MTISKTSKLCTGNDNSYADEFVILACIIMTILTDLCAVNFVSPFAFSAGFNNKSGAAPLIRWPSNSSIRSTVGVQASG